MFLSLRPYLTWKKYMTVWLYISLLLSSVGSRERNASFMAFSGSWETLFVVVFWYFISQRTISSKGEDFKFCHGFRPPLECEHFWGQCINISAQFFSITYLHFDCHQSSGISQNLSPGKFLLSSDIYEYLHEVEQGASPSHHPTNKERKN